VQKRYCAVNRNSIAAPDILAMVDAGLMALATGDNAAMHWARSYVRLANGRIKPQPSARSRRMYTCGSSQALGKGRKNDLLKRTLEKAKTTTVLSKRMKLYLAPAKKH
jgi:hypothetical protein